MSPVSRPRAKKDLGAALFGKGRRNVLAALFRNPGEPMYLREIIAAVGMGSGHVQRELENLTQAGLVLREERARQVYYRPDPKAPVFEELSAIVFKTFGVADVLRKALLPLAAKIRLAFIHGSVAREEDTARSDIDTGALKQEATSVAEIRRLLELARGSLASAGLKSNPLEVRYQLAYAAAHYVAICRISYRGR